MKHMHYLMAIGFSLLLFSSTARAVRLSDLGPLTISTGEQVDFKSIVDTVTLNNQEAKVTANFKDTSILAAGRHKLVYTALTFSGESRIVETTLDVNHSNALSNTPVFSDLSAVEFSQGTLFNLKRTAVATDAAGTKLKYSLSVAYPEHLAAGSHSIYYTAIDSSGKSRVEKITATVNVVADKYRKAEWNRLGTELFNKYVDMSRFNSTTYIREDYKSGNNFSYSTTESGIYAGIAVSTLYYDKFSFNDFPGRMEHFASRMMMLLKELNHHRYLWIDQQKVILTIHHVMEHPIPDNANSKRHRNLAMEIPTDVFMKENFEQTIMDALHTLSEISAPRKRRADNGAPINHNVYKDSETGIEILFLQSMFRRGYESSVLADADAGLVNLEENFNYLLFKQSYQDLLGQLSAGTFGRFHNPKLPVLDSQNVAQ